MTKQTLESVLLKKIESMEGKIDLIISEYGQRITSVEEQTKVFSGTAKELMDKMNKVLDSEMKPEDQKEMKESIKKIGRAHV